jgi:hypothetical protein
MKASALSLRSAAVSAAVAVKLTESGVSAMVKRRGGPVVAAVMLAVSPVGLAL